MISIRPTMTALLIIAVVLSTTSCKQKDLDEIRHAANAAADASNTIKDIKRSATEYAQNQVANHLPPQAYPSNIASAGVCDFNFYQGVKPTVPAKQQTGSQFLCFNGFAVLYSPITRTPLWSAEYLTVDRISKAALLPRVDNFHEESRLPSYAKAKLSDYTLTGYDRGHLSPNGDMADTSSQFDSFSLANIAPQNPELNRGAWMYLESDVRKTVAKYGQAYVVTGVAYQGSNIKQLKGSVFIPTLFFKAVLIPSNKQTLFYVAENTANGQVKNVSLQEFTQLTGVNPFPVLNFQNQGYTSYATGKK